MEQNLYITRDLAESAALIVNNQRLIEIRKIGKTCWFYFDDNSTCKKISNEYFFGRLMVDARIYYEALTRMKNRIFSNR